MCAIFLIYMGGIINFIISWKSSIKCMRCEVNEY